MLTYPCQSVVYQFLDFEKRCHVAKRCRQVRNRHRILPLHIRNLEISQFENYFHLKIDNYNTWIFPDMDRPFSEYWTCISHEKEAIGNEKTKKINCHVEKIVEKVLIYYLGRTETIVQNLTIKGKVRIPSQIAPLKISTLQVRSDEPIATWYHVACGNSFSDVEMGGRAVFDLLKEPEIQNSKQVTICTSSKNIQVVAREKLTKCRNLRIEFSSFLGNYHQLSQEIFEISRENRPIGSIIDYCVHDYFNTKLYPNFAKIVADLKAKRTKIGRINAITIPMESDVELNVFIVPEDEERIKNTWILRMAVMEKKKS